MKQKPTIEFTRIERTDNDVDNSRIEMKVPYEIIDEYGTKATMYRKESITIEDLEAQKEALQKQIDDIDEKLTLIK